MANPAVSMVLCTRNRAPLLPKAVGSILEASRRAHGRVVELIVVDNGSSDGTASVVQGMAEDASIPMVVLSEPRAGLCRAKNAGVRAARGDIIVFTDDDCVLSPDYFEQVIRNFEADRGPVVRGGRVELGNAADLPFTIKTDTCPQIYDGNRHPAGFLHGCNMAVSRAVFQSVGLFDEEFGPGAAFRAAEDTEFVYRAFKKGIPVLYVPDIVVYHHHGRRAHAEISELYNLYQFGNGALHAKYGLGDRLLLRNLYWNLRGCVKEAFGVKFDEPMGLSHREIVFPQIRGFWNYLTHAR